MKCISLNCCYNLCSVLAIAGSYIFQSLSVFAFVYIIYITYISEPPTTWAESSGLPGIGDLYYPAFFMYSHIISGCIIMIAGLIQIWPFIRRRPFLWIHQISGSIICIFSISVAIFGNLYIISSGTAGGPNMSVAFSLYGIILGSFATVTYVMARQKKFILHREWALRTWIQIYASLFYRLCYFLLDLLFDYSVNSPEDFLRPLDEILDWFFFLFPMICMELYIQWPKIMKYIADKRSKSRQMNNMEYIFLS